jgi:hypothetical protein
MSFTQASCSDRLLPLRLGFFMYAPVRVGMSWESYEGRLAFRGIKLRVSELEFFAVGEES